MTIMLTDVWMLFFFEKFHQFKYSVLEKKNSVENEHLEKTDTR